MSYNDDLPTWGATGSKPFDDTSRSPGDNIPASEYNYLWYILNETFGDIDTDLSNIEQGGVADDPHGNEEHSTNYLPSNNYNPVSDVEAKTSALNIDIDGDADTVDGQDASAFADATHGNEAHSEDYITSGEVDGGAPDPHGNSSHSTNYLPSNNYNPVSDVESVTTPLNIDIGGDADTVDGQDASAFADATHGNEAHSEDYITSGQVDGGAPDPHGNSSHTTTFAVDGVAQPPENHGNEAHSENYITSGEIDGGAPDPHGNSSHSTNFLPSNNYDPVGDIEAEITPLNIDISGDADTVDGQDASGFANDPHGNEAHEPTFLKQSDDLIIGTSEIHFKDPSLDADGDGDIDGSDVVQHYSDFQSTRSYRDLLQTIYSFRTVESTQPAPPRDENGNIPLEPTIQSGTNTLTFGVRPPLDAAPLNITGEPIIIRNDAGDRVAEIDSNGNLKIAGTVTANATF